MTAEEPFSDIWRLISNCLQIIDSRPFYRSGFRGYCDQDYPVLRSLERSVEKHYSLPQQRAFRADLIARLDAAR